MNKLRKLRSSMAVNIIGAIVILLVAFAIIVSEIGFASFTKTLKREYSEATYHMANTATALINGDHLDEYLAGEETEEYEHSKKQLEYFCEKMGVSMIYLIKVDTSDYGRFVSIFNPVENSVDDTSYTEWELGHERDTTNDEYRQKYKAIYEQRAPYETVFRMKTTDGQHPHITTMVPVKDSGGEVVGILCVQRPARIIDDAIRPVKKIALTTIMLALLSSIIAALFLRNQFVKPIQKVSKETTRFARENTKGKSLNGISKYNELAQLAQSIDTMETDMVGYIDDITKAAAEKERIATELNLASRIQADMLPNVFPAFPDHPEIDVYATMTPAKDVGGDFYDYFLIDDDHLALVIADVAGKGIPAALFMMGSQILLRNFAMSGLGPKEILESANRQICSNNREEMFVTVWLGILDLRNGHLTAANAGHEYPILKDTGCSFELIKDQHGFVVGGMPDVTYKEYELIMQPGSKLFLYTDGLPEATDRQKQLFGMDRLLQELRRSENSSPKEILNTIERGVKLFVGKAPQFDDLTMMCVHYIGKSFPKDPAFQGQEMTIEATLANIPAVTDFVDAQLEAYGCPPKVVMQINIAIDELFGNIAHYAYDPDTGPATVRVEVDDEPMTVLITFIDHGKPYDPLAAADPDTTLSAEARKIGGLGVFLVKKTMDDISYEYKNGRNILHIRKKIRDK